MLLIPAQMNIFNGQKRLALNPVLFINLILFIMKVDLFVSVTNQPLPFNTTSYGLIESINYIPTLHAYWYSGLTGKVYEIVDMLQMVDRIICICIERPLDVSTIISIPGAFDAPDVCYPSCP